MTDDLESALCDSIKVYRDVLNELAALNQLTLDSPAELIAAGAETLNGRLEKAHQSHLSVNNALTNNDDETMALMREWQDLVTRVDEENRLLSARFRGMMSVIADELSRIKGGRTALKGYASGKDMKGGRLKGAS